MVLQLAKSIFDIFPAAARLYLSVCPTSTVGSSYNPTLCICHKPCQKYLLSLQKLTGKWRLVDFPPLCQNPRSWVENADRGVNRVNTALQGGSWMLQLTGRILCHHLSISFHQLHIERQSELGNFDSVFIIQTYCKGSLSWRTRFFVGFDTSKSDDLSLKSDHSISPSVHESSPKTELGGQVNFVPEMPPLKEKEGDTGVLIFPLLHKLAQTMIFSQLEETIVFADYSWEVMDFSPLLNLSKVFNTPSNGQQNCLNVWTSWLGLTSL